MKLKNIYETVVEKGIDVDPRGRKSVQKALAKAKKRYEGMKEDEKKYFDEESLKNPYSDTRILHGTGNEDVKTLLAGIDIGVAEILLADRLSSKGKRIDLVVSHHPGGKAYASLYEVMGMQAEIFSLFGVPINVAEGLLEGRVKEVERRISPVNHTQALDAAKLIDIPFMCAHTPADNHVSGYLQKIFNRKKHDTAGDVLDALLEIPEYQEAARNNAGPKIFAGNKARSAGKVFVDMTGGTGGPKEIYEKLSASGVGTVVGMHIGDDHRKLAEDHNVNVVIAGHIASDNLGMNLLFDEIEKKGRLNIIECSGFRRFSRIKKK
ncbi:MAG: NGG1p interacting factor NIF3 [Nitrospirae bacterium]|nr:NGG1p interacting factor NIF3 [Nitrospirota bacterium]